MSDKTLTCGATLKGNCAATNGVSDARWYHSILCTLQAVVDGITSVALGRTATGTLASSTGAELTVKYAKAQVAAAQTDASLIALVTGKRIRVLGLVIDTAGTATTSVFQSNAVAISGVFHQSASENVVLPPSPLGYFQTVAGEALKVTTGAGAATDYTIVYVEV
jgi:hypothetical protein